VNGPPGVRVHGTPFLNYLFIIFYNVV